MTEMTEKYISHVVADVFLLVCFILLLFKVKMNEKGYLVSLSWVLDTFKVDKRFQLQFCKTDE